MHVGFTSDSYYGVLHVTTQIVYIITFSSVVGVVAQFKNIFKYSAQFEGLSKTHMTK